MPVYFQIQDIPKSQNITLTKTVTKAQRSYNQRGFKSSLKTQVDTNLPV